MGLIKDILSKSVGFVSEEILPVRQELVKAGILAPPKPQDYGPKASLIDPYSYNATIHGYKEKFTFIDYAKARQISYSDPVLSAILQTRTNQVGAFAVPQVDRYKTGFKISLRDKKKKGTGAQRKKAHEIEQFMMSCGYPETFDDTPEIKKRDSFEIFLRKIARDSLTFDQLNFEIVPRRNGLPGQFIAVDAGTIRLLPDDNERRDAYGGYGEAFDRDLIVSPYTQRQNISPTKSPRYVQVINGTPRATFEEWEMAFGIRNPRTDILANGYGFSEIEMLLTTITAHINADTYNRRFFSQGSSQKGILAFEGNVPPDQLEAFRRQWHQQVSGVQNAWKTPIVAVGKDSKLNWVSLHSTNREMEWGKYIEYLVKTVCGVYQIDPIEIGFDIAKNTSGQGGGSSLGGQGQQVERLKFSKDKGLDPLLRFIANLLNEYLVWRIDDEYEFEFVGLNATSESEQLDIDEKQVNTFKMIDELRAEHDMPPLPKPEDMKSPGQFIMNPTFIQAYSALSQAAQGAAGGVGPDGQPLPGGQPGADDGSQPLDDGSGEPDYGNMSDEDLQAELDKLQGKPGKPQPGQPQPGQPGQPQPGKPQPPQQKTTFAKAEIIL